MSATATASLVRSLKSISVHYRHRRDWLSSVRPCGWQDFSTSKVCVQKCPPCAWSRTQTPRRGRHCLTASSMTTWWKCSHSSIRRDFSWSTSRGCGTHDPAASTNLVVDWLMSGLLAGHRDEVMKSGVLWVNKCTVCLTCSVGWTPECLTAVCDSDTILETEIFCRQYLDINNLCNK